MEHINKVSGKVIDVLEQESRPKTDGTGNYYKQEFIVETEGKYPQKICLSLHGDKCDLVPKLGASVTVSFNPSSKEYKGKWYSEFKAWKIENN